jgi:hypothetical protein
MPTKRKYPSEFFKIEKNKKNFNDEELNRSQQLIINNISQARKSNKNKGHLLNQGFPIFKEEVLLIKEKQKEESNIDKLEQYFQRSRITIQLILDGKYDYKLETNKKSKTINAIPKSNVAIRRYKDLSDDELMIIIKNSNNNNRKDLINEISYREGSSKKSLLTALDNEGESDEWDDYVPDYDEPDNNENIIQQISQSNELLRKLQLVIRFEINEQKKKLKSSGVEIANGRFAEDASGTGYIYEFDLLNDLYTKDNIPAKITIENSDFDCEIITIKNRTILIRSEQKLNVPISSAEIKIDMSYLNQRLLTQLELLPNEDNENYKITNAEKVFGKKPIQYISKDPISHGTLNNLQKSFLSASQSYDVSFLWGPPGTGKTYTLAEVVYNSYKDNKKILLVSNTNSAIDTLLLSLCDYLHENNDKDFIQGAVLRDNEIIDSNLKVKYQEFIDIDKIVIRLTTELQEKKNEILISLDELNRELETLNLTKNNFQKLRLVRSNLFKKKDQLSQLNNQIIKYKSDKSSCEKSLRNLDQELNNINKSRTIGRIFQRSIQNVNYDIDFNKSELEKIKLKIIETEKLQITIPEDIEKYEKEKNTLEEELVEKTESKIIHEINKLNSEVDKIQKELDKINTKISKARENIYKNAKVIGSTATQSYLRPKFFSNFDVVIIDEASMLNLPTIYYLACLAEEKVIISGDFQQLPPIVQTKKEEILNWLKKDIFTFNNIPNLVLENKLPKNVIQLQKQYRMTNNIQNLLNEKFYNGKLIASKNVGFNKNITLPEELDSDIVIIDTSHFNPFQSMRPNSRSRYNILNSVLIREIVNRLLDNDENINQDDIGVVTPYAAQSEIIRSILQDKRTSNIEASTVHKYQGKEKNIIIYDIPDTFGSGGIGRFISVDDLKQDGAKLNNVAISRARGQLIVVCNYQFLMKKLNKDSLIYGILKKITDTGKIIDANKLITKEKIIETLSSSNLNEINQKNHTKEIIYKKNSSKDRRSYNHFNQKNFFDALEKDIFRAKRWVIIYSGFIYLNRVKLLKPIFSKKISEGLRIICRFRLPEKTHKHKKIIEEAIASLREIGVQIDFINEEHKKFCFIDDAILYHGSINILSLSNIPSSSEFMTRDTNKIYIESIAKHINEYGRVNKEMTNIEYLSYSRNPKCNTCNSDTFSLNKIGSRNQFFCIECGNEYKDQFYNRHIRK